MYSELAEKKCWRVFLFDTKEDYDAFIEEITTLLTKRPNDRVLLNNRGVAYWEIGLLDLALTDLRKACELSDSDYAPFLNLSGVLRSLGEMDKSLDAASKAVQASPSEPSCYFTRARIYREMGNEVGYENDRKSGEKLKGER